MRNVAVFTGTRADYGLLYWLMKDIELDQDLQLQLIVSGMHLSPEFGLTHQQIQHDGFHIDAKVEMLLSSDTPTGVAKAMGLGIIGYADALDRLAPDMLVLLGDRFETLAMAQTALVMKIPVIHLHGGEITEGAYDDAIRHAISKLASYHFVAANPYRARLIQMGEPPERVFHVGALGLDHLRRTPLPPLSELAASLEFPLTRPYLLVTYHPVTWGEEPPEASFKALLKALDAYETHQVILTYPNADDGGRQIIALIESYAAGHPDRVLAIPSLGQRRYLAAIRDAAAVIGNSSSGMIEVPSFAVPTVNIGRRQQGRLGAASIVHCDAERNAIQEAISQVLSPDFKCHLDGQNPYDLGGASERIITQLKQCELAVSKSFHDLVGNASRSLA